MGGLLLWDDAKQLFDVSSTAFMFKGKDGKDKMMTLEVRPWCTNDEAGGTSFGVIFYGEKGYMTLAELRRLRGSSKAGRPSSSHRRKTART